MAIDLDGTNDYVDCGSGATLDNITTVTYAVWIYADTLPTNALLFEKRPAATNDGPVFYLGDPSGGLTRIRFVQGWSTADAVWYTNSRVVSAGVWTHVAVTYDRSSTSNDPVFYLNGVSQTVFESTAPSGTVDSDAAVSLLLGIQTGGADNPFDGKMEDARVFNRILTADEAAILAAGYRGPLGGEVGWWSCHDFLAVTHPDGTTLTVTTNNLPDLSGNGNDGAPTGGVIARASDAPSAFPMWLPFTYSGGFAQAVAGALSFVGTVSRNTAKPIAGALSWVGAVVKAVSITSGFTGALSFVGSTVKQAQKPVAGALSWVGTLVGRANKVLAGALTFVGVGTGVLGQIVLFFATVRSLFKGHDQDDVLSAPERSRKHKG